MTPEQLAAIRALLAAGEPIPPELGRVLFRRWSCLDRVVADVRSALHNYGLPMNAPLGDTVTDLIERAGAMGERP